MNGIRSRLRGLALLGPALIAVSLSGCANDAVEPGLSGSAEFGEAAFGRRKLATLEWNQLALGMIEKHKPAQQTAQRGMAYLTLAQFVAADAARRHGPGPAVTLGALAGASAVVLAYVFPADSAAFEAEVRAREAALEPGRQARFRTGETLGRAIGARAVSRARIDRYDAPWTGTVPTGPGIWFSSAVPAAPPSLPMLGQVEPFFLGSGSQVRPAAPPAFGSAAFHEGLEEVRRVSDTRTSRQDSIAKFWAMGTGTLIAGFWNATAAELIERHRLGERDAARALALMNTASMDGLIACADAKFAYWLLRPSQADPAITLPIGLPNFPSYPSNHSCFSGTAAYVLAALFPEDRTRLRVMAYQAGVSRILGGIHYRFDADAGLKVARDVTRLALNADRHNRMLDLLQGTISIQ